MEIVQELAARFDAFVFWAALLFVALDVVTGYAQAVANREVESSRMREGFWHKVAIVLVLAIAGCVDVVVGHGAELAGAGLDAPVFEAACAYVIVMELTSMLENIKKLNPELADSKLLGLFGGKDGN